MAKQVKEKTIGTVTYRVTQFGGKDGREVMVRLIRLLGPAASGYLKGGKLSEEGIGAALLEFSTNVRPEEFGQLCDLFAAQTVVVEASTIGGVPVALDKIFDDHFAGNFLQMVLWLGFAVNVNYSDFFDVSALGKLLSAHIARMTSESKSQPA